MEEQTVRGPKGSRHVIDILVDLDNYAVALEAEYAPRDCRGDALSRLTEPELRWRGLPVRSVYAVTYPVALKRQAPADAYKALRTTTELAFSHRFHPNIAWAEDYEIRHSHGWSTPMAGGVKDLAEGLRNYWAKTDTGASIESIEGLASEAIALDSDSMNRVPQFGEKGSDPAANKALV